MPRKYKAQGFCVTCGCTTSSRFRCALPGHIRRHEAPASRKQKQDQVCAKCYNRTTSEEAPYVAPSTIKGAGNGLFANRDYKYGEFVCKYGGQVYDQRPTTPSNYIIQIKIGRDLKYIDARYNGGPGRYINEHPTGKNNTKFCVIDGAVCVKTVTKNWAVTNLGRGNKSKIAVKSGAELFISYGDEYW